MGISGELYNLHENYLSNRFQRVLLNGQASSWRLVVAGVSQGSILDSLLFLIYIIYLPNEFKSNAKLFADGTSLFTKVKDKNISGNMLNNDLRRMSKWAYNWKMLFNPDPDKPDKEVVFSRNVKLQSHPTVSLNIMQVERASYLKHLDIWLEENFNFKQHIGSVILKINKGMSLTKKLLSPRKSILTSYKTLFEIVSWLWRYHLRPTTKWMFLW